LSKVYIVVGPHIHNYGISINKLHLERYLLNITTRDCTSTSGYSKLTETECW